MKLIKTTYLLSFFPYAIIATEPIDELSNSHHERSKFASSANALVSDVSLASRADDGASSSARPNSASSSSSSSHYSHDSESSHSASYSSGSFPSPKSQPKFPTWGGKGVNTSRLLSPLIREHAAWFKKEVNPTTIIKNPKKIIPPHEKSGGRAYHTYGMTEEGIEHAKLAAKAPRRRSAAAREARAQKWEALKQAKLEKQAARLKGGAGSSGKGKAPVGAGTEGKGKAPVGGGKGKGPLQIGQGSRGPVREGQGGGRGRGGQGGRGQGSRSGYGGTGRGGQGGRGQATGRGGQGSGSGSGSGGAGRGAPGVRGQGAGGRGRAPTKPDRRNRR